MWATSPTFRGRPEDAHTLNVRCLLTGVKLERAAAPRTAALRTECDYDAGARTTPSCRPASPARWEKNRSLSQRVQSGLMEM